jgi:hypothetical protein
VFAASASASARMICACFRPLRPDRARLLLTGGFHALIGGGERRSFRQVGALDPHVDDFGAILAGDAVQRALDVVHHLAPLRD